MGVGESELPRRGVPTQVEATLHCPNCGHHAAYLFDGEEWISNFAKISTALGNGIDSSCRQLADKIDMFNHVMPKATIRAFAINLLVAVVITIIFVIFN